MPFVTEYLYSNLDETQTKTSILEESWPDLSNEIKNLQISYIEDVFNIIKKIREIRVEQKIPKKNHFSLYLNCATHLQIYMNEINDYLMKIENVIIIDKPFILQEDHKIITKTYADVVINAILSKALLQNNVLALKQDLAKLKQEIIRSEKILNNKSFIERANAQKVQLEKDKYENYLKQENYFTKPFIKFYEIKIWRIQCQNY